MTAHRMVHVKTNASVWDRIVSLFIPQWRPYIVPSIFDGQPQQARRERPFATHTKTRWLQSDVESAIRAADGGELAQAAQLARSMRRDATLSGILSTRAGGLTRLPKIFRGTPEVLAALEARDHVGLFDQIFPAKELELLNADGILLGVGVGEMLPIPGLPIPIFVRLDPEFLSYRWSEDRWYYRSTGGLLPITPGDGRWILHTPGGYLQPWASGLWPSLGRAFVAKEHAYHYRENYSGKLANPARVAVAPQGATEEQRQSWFRRVMAWGVNTVFGLPPGYDVRLLESNGRGYEVFQQTIESADREFMIGLGGQTPTVDGGPGFANADIHQAIRADLIQGDGEGLSATISSQGIAPIVGRLFGAAARGVVQWDTRPPTSLASEANALLVAANTLKALREAWGDAVDAGEMATRFKVPLLAHSEVRDYPAPALPGGAS